MEKEVKAKRSMSDPTSLFESEKEEKKGHGLSNFLHKLPFVSWKHHHHLATCSLEGDDEFCDVEEELKKQKKNNHQEVEKTDDDLKPDKIIILVNESTDTESDSQQEESERKLCHDQMNKQLEEQVTADHAEVENVAGITEEEAEASSIGDDEPHHEPPASPLPPPTKSCLKPSCFDEPHPPPLRKRSISVPEGDPNIVCRLNRHVHFSPDTVDPTPRNCRYREWIERHSNHEKKSINIKHEKRMQQLRQIHSLDINDYLSKGCKRYTNTMVSSPMTLGCDMFL